MLASASTSVAVTFTVSPTAGRETMLPLVSVTVRLVIDGGWVAQAETRIAAWAGALRMPVAAIATAWTR